MKLTLAAALAVSLLLPGISQANDQIVVESHDNAQQAFVSRLASDLTANLRLPYRAGHPIQPTGAVSVTFNCGPDGRPVDIAITHQSGSAAVDRSAVLAVAKLSGFHPASAGFAADLPVRADIIVAEDDEQAARLARRLRQSNERRMLARKPGQRPIELVLTINTTSRV